MFYKKAVVKNFAIFTGKNLRWSLFLIKLQDSGKETPTEVFFRELYKKNFEEYLGTTASVKNYPRRLLLYKALFL